MRVRHPRFEHGTVWNASGTIWNGGGLTLKPDIRKLLADALAGRGCEAAVGTPIDLRAELAAVTAPAEVPTRFWLMPWGRVEFRDGRSPALVDEVSVQTVPASFAGRTIGMNVDYDHRTFRGSVPDTRAAGWIVKLEVVAPGNTDGVNPGVWMDVEWTQRGRAELADKQYRYFSPVFLRDYDSGRVLAVENVALTNDPAITLAQPILEAAARNFGGRFAIPQTNPETLLMNEAQLAQLRTTLGLAADASVETVLAAAQTAVGIQTAAAKALGLELAACNPSAIQLRAEQMASKAGFVPQAEHDKLKLELASTDAAKRVERAIEAGKLLPAQRETALEFAMRDPAQFDAFVAATPVMTPEPGRATGPKTQPPGSAKPGTPELASVTRQLGLSADDIKKYGPQPDTN